ncbi:MAG: hypothetical protein P8Z49_06475 [Acidobacteriota bacterium]
MALPMASIPSLPVDADENLSIRSKLWHLLAGLGVIAAFLRCEGLKIAGGAGLDNPAVHLYAAAGGVLLIGARIVGHQGNRDGVPRVKKRRKSLWTGLATWLFPCAEMELYARGPARSAAPNFATNSLVVARLSIWRPGERPLRIQIHAPDAIMAGLILVQL